jgi:hypothetical protein
MKKKKVEELIKYLEDQIVEYEVNLKNIKSDTDEFSGFCKGIITGFKYVRGALKNDLKEPLND